VAPAGKKRKLVKGIETMASSSAIWPITAPIDPRESGAYFRDNDGQRRSASTKTTRPPASAMRCARLAAMVDLPSLDNVEVTAMTLCDFNAPLKSAAIFTDLIASGTALR
jgi:hypothetical protein